VKGQLNEAAGDFSRAAELQPNYANAWFNRGEIRYEQGKFQDAIADYTRAIDLNREDYDIYIRRGHAYFKIRKFQEALADYDRAVKIVPDNVEALVNRADANRSLGRWQMAADDYLKAVQLDEKSGRAYQGAAWLMATCPDAKVRNKDLALRAAQQALDLLGRQDYKALDTMAAALANAGDFAKARQSLNEAMKVAPEGVAPTLQKRLQLYQQDQPFRDQ
jgi:tetratricopeptide (TPR) repeat protein